jgi:serine/threonine-protein kinase
MTALIEPGTVFADKYVIETQLGVGAAGVVYSATHTDLRQRVAIKILRGTDGFGIERMIREARAALALQSEHVVRVMDVGRDREGRAFIVMEQLTGDDLGSVLRGRVRFSIAEAVDYVLQACAGIAEAHARGIVHRDLKPSNLFLTRRADGSPLVKVLDFGISKSIEDADSEASITGPTQVVGSPLYMSPEQIYGASSVDHRADIWSLGVIIFRFLTGKAPFGGSGKGVSGALASVVIDATPSARALVPEVPVELDRVVMRCLSKSPDDRPSSVAELAARLAPFGTDDGRAAVVRLVRGVSEAKSWPRRRSSRAPVISARRLVLGACAITVLAIPAAALALRAHGRHATVEAASVPASTSATPALRPPPLETPLATSEGFAPALLPSPSSLPPVPSHAPPLRVPGRPHVPPSASSAHMVKSAATDDRY